MKNLTATFVVLLLSACVQPPKPLRGEFSDTSPEAYQQNPVENLNVRWTGFVVDVTNKDDHSCLTIISKVPDALARPSKRVRVDQGRFIACKPKFLEPDFFMKKPVTVTGTVKKLIKKPLDEMNYEYPLVDTNVIYVW